MGKCRRVARVGGQVSPAGYGVVVALFVVRAKELIRGRVCIRIVVYSRAIVGVDGEV